MPEIQRFAENGGSPSWIAFIASLQCVRQARQPFAWNAILRVTGAMCLAFWGFGPCLRGAG